MNCVPCTGSELPQAAAVIGTILLVLVLLVYACRRRLRRLRKKYENAWRDILRIFTINLSFAQVNNSLSIMLDIPLPSLYQRFLDSCTSWVNVDLIKILSVDCVGTVNYFSNVGMACFIPLCIVFTTILRILVQQQRASSLMKQINTPKETTAAKRLRENVASYIFDLADTDGGGTVDMSELGDLLTTVQSKKKFTPAQLKSFLQEVNDTNGGRDDAFSISTENLSMNREDFVATATDSTKAPLMEKFLGKKWLKWGATQRNYAKHGESCLTFLFLVHAPVSQRLFMFFACQDVGTIRSFLKADYSIECNEGQHAALWPFVLTYLIIFAVLFPGIILMLLWYHRKSLYAPSQQNKFGFLYRRFSKGAEFWEIHELFRKLLLTGALIFLPHNTRATAAIVICIMACCSLNYYQPHMNRIVFGIAQLSFLISPLKYLVTILIALNQTKRETDANQLDVTLMGYSLVGLDIMFMCGSIVSGCTVVYLLRKSLKRSANATVVVPAKPGSGGGVTEVAVTKTSSKNTSKRKLTKQMSLQQIRTVVVKDKVARVEQSHAASRKAAMDKIRKREKHADSRVRQRLIERRKESEKSNSSKKTDVKNWKVLQPTDEPSEQSLVMIEKVRSILKKKIGTLQRLRGAFAKLDLDHNGVLSKGEFERLVGAILKKKSVDKKKLGLLWKAARAQRKHGAEDEIDAPTLGHWLCLESDA
jgi:Ca2+-binding EF-hand superfamily protein